MRLSVSDPALGPSCGELIENSGPFCTIGQADTYGQATCNLCAGMGNCGYMLCLCSKLWRSIRLSVHHRSRRSGFQSYYSSVSLSVLHQAIPRSEGRHLARNGSNGVGYLVSGDFLDANLLEGSSMASSRTPYLSFTAINSSPGGSCSSSKGVSQFYLLS